MKKTKKSLVLSIITLLLCSCMFIGSTFAWFTDTVSNTGNKIQAGTLKIGLSQWKKASPDADPSWIDISGDNKAVFYSEKWEPGYSQYAVIKLSNKDNLALKFKLLLKVNGSLEENAEGHTLADAIEVYGFKTTSEADAKAAYGKGTFAEFTALGNVKDLGSLSSFLFDEDGVAYGALLPSGETSETIPVGDVYSVLALHMKEEAGNEYQGLGLGTTFDIVAQATQYSYEKDGFDSELYDALADGTPDHPEFDHESAIPTIKKLVLPTSGDSKVVSQPTTVTNKGLSVEFPAGTKLSSNTKEAEDGKTADAELGFEYKGDEARAEGIEIRDNQSVMSFELTLNADDENDKLIKFSYNIGKGLIAPEAYHDGELLNATENNSDTPNEESSHYDEATGELTAWVYHASPIEIVYYSSIPEAPEDAIARIGYDTEDYFTDLKAAFNAAKARKGGTITLLDDISINSNFDFKGNFESDDDRYGRQYTLDLNGHTISVNSSRCMELADSSYIVKDSVGGGKITKSSGSTLVFQVNQGHDSYKASLAKCPTFIVKGGQFDSVGDINDPYNTNFGLSIAAGATGDGYTYACNFSISGGTIRNLGILDGKGTISGGKFSGQIRIWAENATYSEGTTVDDLVCTITGGEFNLSNDKPIILYNGTSKDHLVIKGGVFNFDPSDYVANGFKAIENSGIWTVIPKAD